jgi:hypothetical protein
MKCKKPNFLLKSKRDSKSEIQRSPPSLPHLLIGTKNFRSWLTTPRLKTENISSREVAMRDHYPLGLIYRLNQKTKMPLGPNTIKTAKLG